jgi:hypothetical protein
MLANLLPSRRRAEARRVERFLHAIHLSERYAVNPDWNLTPTTDEAPQWPADRTDTVAFPRIILAGTVLAATAVLSACTGTPAEAPAQVSARPTVEQPDMSGPGRAYTDQQLRDAVRGIAPWLVQR